MKSSFYLKHDLDSRSDDKMRSIMMKFGARGYGIYWLIVEDLYRGKGRMVRDYAALAWAYHEPAKDIKAIVEGFDAFYDDGGKISCHRVDRGLSEREEAQEIASRAGKASAVQRALNARSAQANQERRGEERKGEDKTAAPSAAELSTTVDKLCMEKTFDDLGRLPFKHGDCPKGTPIIDMDAKSCQSVLDSHKNLGFKLERALRSRINLRKMECAK